ncbi:MAG: hypothetical protein QOJ93_22 [Actinomycetota bacterium]|jgi:hypothetical protein|nr:hypothetical protein [Actinomycetota bacterium]
MDTTYNGIPASELQCARWRKSSFSGNGNNNCVEMTRLVTGEVAVRNSRDPDGPTLIYTRAEVEALIRGVRNGEFDDLIS